MIMTATVEVKDLAGRWAELLASAAAGNDVIVTDGSVPKARLVPLQTRVLGLHPGAMETSDDFDNPLPDRFWTRSE
jgi:prevent-host-death family protein